MDNFRLPASNPHQERPRGTIPGNYVSPSGMLLPRHQQPPPMYGARGSTVPPKYLGEHYRGQSRPQRNRHPSSNNRGPSGISKREFWCETCARGFNSSTELDEHINEHQPCGIDGCKFVGHPLVVTKHIQQQHTSNVYDKIKKLDTPEDIAKWREERKKRYPSRANIELRQQAQEAKIKRGERLENPKNRFGKPQERRPTVRDYTCKQPKIEATKEVEKRPPNPNKRVRKPKRVHEPAPPQEEKVAEEKTLNGSLPMFQGTIKLENYKRIKVEVLQSNPLSSIVGMYGSDDEPESVEELIYVPAEEKLSPPPRQRVSHSDSDDIPEETPIQRKSSELPITSVTEDRGVSVPSTPSQQSGRKRKRPGSKESATTVTRREKPISKSLLDYSKLRRPPNTMLSKLLQPQIRHERNVLLQCVRFVVNNKFFGVGQPALKENNEAKPPEEL